MKGKATLGEMLPKEALGIKRNLAIGFSIAFLAVLFGFLVSFFIAARDYQSKDQLLNASLFEASNAFYLVRIREETAVDLRAFVLTGDESFLETRARSLTYFETVLSRLEADATRLENRLLLKKVRSSSSAVVSVGDEIIRMKRAGVSRRKILKVFETQFLPRSLTLQRDLTDLSQFSEHLVEEARQGAQETTRKSLGNILALTFGTFLIALMIARLIITWMDQAYRRLQESESRFRLAIDVSGDANWERDIATGKMVWGSGLIKTFKYFEKDLGSSFKWFIGRIHPEDRERVARKEEEALQQHASYYRTDFRLFRGDESIAYVITRVFFWYDEQGRPAKSIGMLTDVSEFKHAVQARDEMVGVISHELNNPLTAIGTRIEVLMRTLSESSSIEQVKDALQKMKPSLQRMSRLISDLLDNTRIEAKTLRIEPHFYNLSEMMNNVLAIYKSIAAEKSIGLKVTVSSHTLSAYYDRERIEQVLSNLVDNAFKFTQKQGAISIEAGPGSVGVEIRITDSGTGIEQENLEKVFDRYWQAKDRRFHGTGLGLSIAKGIVEAHGGQIWVESKYGVGSTFHFTLPATLEEYLRWTSGKVDFTALSKAG